MAAIKLLHLADTVAAIRCIRVLRTSGSLL
jgi:hypothetical protein